MASITIDNQEYEIDSLSDKARATVVSLQFVQTELKKLEAQIAIYKTAEAAYSASLKEELSS